MCACGNVFGKVTRLQFKVILKADSSISSTLTLKDCEFYKFSGADVGFVKAGCTAIHHPHHQSKTKKLKANPGDLTVEMQAGEMKTVWQNGPGWIMRKNIW